MSAVDAIRRALPAESVLDGVPAAYLVDETQTRSVSGHADLVAVPRTVEEVAEMVRLAYENDVPIVPRGGGSGYAGGAVPNGGIVLSLERLNAIRRFDPQLWRIEAEAGVITRDLHRLARENGLYYPPDPGASEQSQIGGNIATNAGGPHAFKYGTTGAWITGLEVVVPPGEVIRLGGAVRKDVAGYDLKRLLIGSEGTLGVITAAWIRLIPAPETNGAAVLAFAGARDGCDAIELLVGSGVDVTALEFIDEGALAATPAPFLDYPGAAFAVLVEVDGRTAEVHDLLREVIEICDRAVAVHVPSSPAETVAVRRWREGMTAGVTAQLGGKMSEDIVVPLDRLHDAIEATEAIGERHGLRACSWGHAGDGNLHSTFMIRRESADDRDAASAAAHDLFELAIDLGGSISGEHGIGLEKVGFLEKAWQPPAYRIHRGVKELFDPRNLMNPGKKL